MVKSTSTGTTIAEAAGAPRLGLRAAIGSWRPGLRAADRRPAARFGACRGAAARFGAPPRARRPGPARGDPARARRGVPPLPAGRGLAVRDGLARLPPPARVPVVGGAGGRGPGVADGPGGPADRARGAAAGTTAGADLRAIGWSRAMILRWVAAEALVGSVLVACLALAAWFVGGRVAPALAVGTALALIWLVAALLGAERAVRVSRPSQAQSGEAALGLRSDRFLAAAGPVGFALRSLVALPGRTTMEVCGPGVAAAQSRWPASR